MLTCRHLNAGNGRRDGNTTNPRIRGDEWIDKKTYHRIDWVGVSGSQERSARSWNGSFLDQADIISSTGSSRVRIAASTAHASQDNSRSWIIPDFLGSRHMSREVDGKESIT